MLIYSPTQQVGTAALLLTCLIALWRGNGTDKLGAALISVAWVITPLVEVRKSWYQFQGGIFTVDLVTLVGLVALAILSNRRWPICAAAFQTFAVLTHVAFLVNPHALFRAYLYANFGISYLLLGSLVGGVIIESGGSPWPWRGRSSRAQEKAPAQPLRPPPRRKNAKHPA